MSKDFSELNANIVQPFLNKLVDLVGDDFPRKILFNEWVLGVERSWTKIRSVEDKSGSDVIARIAIGSGGIRDRMKSARTLSQVKPDLEIVYATGTYCFFEFGARRDILVEIEKFVKEADSWIGEDFLSQKLKIFKYGQEIVPFIGREIKFLKTFESEHHSVKLPNFSAKKEIKSTAEFESEFKKIAKKIHAAYIHTLKQNPSNKFLLSQFSNFQKEVQKFGYSKKLSESDEKIITSLIHYDQRQTALDDFFMELSCKDVSYSQDELKQIFSKLTFSKTDVELIKSNLFEIIENHLNSKKNPNEIVDTCIYFIRKLNRTDIDLKSIEDDLCRLRFVKIHLLSQNKNPVPRKSFTVNIGPDEKTVSTNDLGIAVLNLSKSNLNSIQLYDKSFELGAGAISEITHTLKKFKPKAPIFKKKSDNIIVNNEEENSFTGNKSPDGNDAPGENKVAERGPLSIFSIIVFPLILLGLLLFLIYALGDVTETYTVESKINLSKEITSVIAVSFGKFGEAPDSYHREIITLNGTISIENVGEGAFVEEYYLTDDFEKSVKIDRLSSAQQSFVRAQEGNYITVVGEYNKFNGGSLMVSELSLFAREITKQVLEEEVLFEERNISIKRYELWLNKLK